MLRLHFSLPPVYSHLYFHGLSSSPRALSRICWCVLTHLAFAYPPKSYEWLAKADGTSSQTVRHAKVTLRHYQSIGCVGQQSFHGLWHVKSKSCQATSRKTDRSGSISMRRCLMTRIWSCPWSHVCTSQSMRHERQHTSTP